MSSSVPSPGPSPHGECSECGAAVGPAGSCGFCDRLEAIMASDEKARWDDLVERVREEHFDRTVGGLCRPIEEGPA